jgi:hypothetical protein
VDARPIGVRLTTGGMMIPTKSISGIIGLGPARDRIRVNPCTGCPDTACDHRRPDMPPGAGARAKGPA